MEAAWSFARGLVQAEYRWDIVGPTRDLDIATVGLNWYWWKNAKSQFQFSHSDLTDPVAGSSGVNTLTGRVQFDF